MTTDEFDAKLNAAKKRVTAPARQKRRTICHAATVFEDPECRKLFVESWTLLGIMDLYDGHLEAYLGTIHSGISDRNALIKELAERLAKILYVASTPQNP